MQKVKQNTLQQNKMKQNKLQHHKCQPFLGGEPRDAFLPDFPVNNVHDAVCCHHYSLGLNISYEKKICEP